MNEKNVLTADRYDFVDGAMRMVRATCRISNINPDGDFEAATSMADKDTPAVALKRTPSSKVISDILPQNTMRTESRATGADGTPIYHKSSTNQQEQSEEQKRFRKYLNKQAREAVKGSIHEKTSLIVYRPTATAAQHEEYKETVVKLFPVIRKLSKRTKPLLEHDTPVSLLQNRVYGTTFHAEKTAPADFRYFSQKVPPEENPSLAVALRIDQPASMEAFGHLEVAKQAAAAVRGFCNEYNIPVLIYGDTADCSPK